jgi:hypothetical protein
MGQGLVLEQFKKQYGPDITGGGFSGGLSQVALVTFPRYSYLSNVAPFPLQRITPEIVGNPTYGEYDHGVESGNVGSLGVTSINYEDLSGKIIILQHNPGNQGIWWNADYVTINMNSGFTVPSTIVSGLVVYFQNLAWATFSEVIHDTLYGGAIGNPGHAFSELSNFVKGVPHVAEIDTPLNFGIEWSPNQENKGQLFYGKDFLIFGNRIQLTDGTNGATDWTPTVQANVLGLLNVTISMRS